MRNITSFSDKLLIKAASSYVYMISNNQHYNNGIETVKAQLAVDFNGRYTLYHAEPQAFYREETLIDLRYMILLDIQSQEAALIFQGSDQDYASLLSGTDTDWAHNMSSAAHLELSNYDRALNEFKFLQATLNYKITAVSGNSLGGGYALHIGSHIKNLRVLGVNPSPPEVSSLYRNLGFSTILLTNQDLLSRLLKTDSYRSHYGDKDSFLKIFGLSPIVIHRSFPYSSAAFIQLNHVGALLDDKLLLMDLYEQNKTYYNAKIIQSPQGLNFSKTLLKQLVSQLNHQDYITYNKTIENVLFPSTQNLFESYARIVDLSEYVGLDIMNDNLLNQRGKTFYWHRYKISNKTMFFNQLKHKVNTIQDYQNYLIENSQLMINDTKENSGFGYTRPSFFTKDLKVNLKLDWNSFKFVLDLPKHFKNHYKDVFDNTLMQLYKLHQVMNTRYLEHFQYDENECESYIDALEAALQTIKQNMNTYHQQLNDMTDFLEQALLKTSKSTVKKTQLIDLEYREQLDKKLLAQSLNAVETALFTHEEDVDTIISDNADLLTTIMRERKEDLEVNTTPSETIQYEQAKSIHQTVDFESLLLNIKVEFKSEVSQIFLQNNYALKTMFNLIQSKEYLVQQKILILNLNHYAKRNLNWIQYRYYLQYYDQILKSIEYIEAQCDQII